MGYATVMMKKMGRAMWLDTNSSKKDYYLLQATRAYALTGEVSPGTKETKPKDLDIADVVRDVVKRFSMRVSRQNHA